MPAHTDSLEPPRACLPTRLRNATQALHTSTERSGAMAQLLAGRLAHAGYLSLLVQLRAIYEALEQALAHHAEQRWLQGVDMATLRRVPALDADLQPWDTAPRHLLEPTRAYVQRVVDLDAATDPALLAHVYTRYLGDLHGGQIMQRIVKRLYPAQATAFHDFGSDDRVAQLRAQLRQSLAGTELPPGQADRVVAEACWSFEQHRLIFEALAASPGAS